MKLLARALLIATHVLVGTAISFCVLVLVIAGRTADSTEDAITALVVVTSGLVGAALVLLEWKLAKPGSSLTAWVARVTGQAPHEAQSIVQSPAPDSPALLRLAYGVAPDPSYPHPKHAFAPPALAGNEAGAREMRTAAAVIEPSPPMARQPPQPIPPHGLPSPRSHVLPTSGAPATTPLSPPARLAPATGPHPPTSPVAIVAGEGTHPPRESLPTAAPARPMPSQPQPPQDAVQKLARAVVDSATFARQHAAAGRHAPRREMVEAALRAALRAGGAIHSAQLAQQLDVPSAEIPGLVAALTRVLNVEAYPVIAQDPDGITIRVNRSLLREQFGVDQ